MDGAYSTHRREQKLPNILAEKFKLERILEGLGLYGRMILKGIVTKRNGSAWTGWLMKKSSGRFL
jgi:hypothetical protein